MRRTGVMTFVEVRRALSQTPDGLHDLVDALPGDAATSREPSSGRSPLGIVSRMANAEDHWIGEVRRLLDRFEVSGRSALVNPSAVGHRRHVSMAAAVEHFARQRQLSLDVLEGVDLEPAIRRTHVDVESGATSLQRLLTRWLRQDLIALTQISRMLLQYYEHEPGLWIHYFSLLNGFEARAALLGPCGR